jgi:hypothetical protein
MRWPDRILCLFVLWIILGLEPLPAVASSQEFSATDQAALRAALIDYFVAPLEKQEKWKFSPQFERLLHDHESVIRRICWEAFTNVPLHNALRADYLTNQVRFQKHLSQYTVRSVGSRPTNGWALFIAMHGGGGAPKEVNDSQWRIMQRYYKDHPEGGGYLYLALRAPNDTWNGFYDVYVYPLIANLIREFLLFGDVNPNKVCILGYSHGGYGAFAIGPKMPDRFAAIHASAAAATDGETTPTTLRNTVFTYMVGEKDTAYDRIKRARNFSEAVTKLRGADTNAYPLRFDEIANNGHTGLPDRDKIKEMLANVRNPVPRHLTWLMTDKVISDFFWLRAGKPGKKQEIDALCNGNQLAVTTTTNVPSALVLLDGRLVDVDRPLTLELNGKVSHHKLEPSLQTLCETMQRRGDPELAFTVQIDLPLANPKPE